MDHVFCIFGDSTAWGAWDLEKGGWANRLWLYLGETHEDIELYNLSISGGTTETILARFESEALIRKADVLIFQTGGNDSAYNRMTKKVLVSPEAFTNNLQNIITKAKAITNTILFIGFKNCDESKTTPVSWIDFDYTNKSIQEHNEIMRTACEKNGVLFIDIFGTLDNNDFFDGLHPNASGHKKIYQKVSAFLKEHKLIN